MNLSRRVRSIPDSGLSRFFDLLASTEGVLSLGVGDPDMPTATEVCAAGIASIKRGETGYTSNAGVLELRERIAEDLLARYGVDYDPESEIIVTVGVSEALHDTILALIDPGDGVIWPEPAFVAYEPIIRIANGVPLPLHTAAADQWQVTKEALASAWRPEAKVLLLNYPNNPTGAVMDRAAMLSLAEFAQERDMVVISDEIYDRFVYGCEHTCFAALPGMRERTVLLGGFSKSYAMTGWRIGFACGPAEIVSAISKLHQFIIMSAPTMAQMGVLAALNCENDAAEGIVAEFAARRDVVVQALADLGLPCVSPQGAIYAFPSVAHTGLSAAEFCERLLIEEKVAVVPGDAFGESGHGHIRIAYTVPVDQLEDAFARMERFLGRL